MGNGKGGSNCPSSQRTSCIKTKLEVSKLCLPTHTLTISIDNHNCRGMCDWDEKGDSWVTDGAGGKSG